MAKKKTKTVRRRRPATPKRLVVPRSTVGDPLELRAACLVQMKALGVSVAWVAARVANHGIEQTTVYRFLDGRNASRWPVAAAVASALGLGVVPVPDRVRAIQSQICKSEA